MSQEKMEEELPTTSETLGTKVSGVASKLAQTFTPLKSICAHINGIHCYAADPERQLEANHYCSHLTEDVLQCVIYDKHDDKHAKLIGVEYIIPEKMFQELPADERKYWHSHECEVKSGMLIMPGLPEMMEDHEMKKLIKTYGKTWHLWQTDRGDLLPYGPPQLMMSITHPEQVDPRLLRARNEKFGVDTVKKWERRKSLPSYVPHPSADQVWRNYRPKSPFDWHESKEGLTFQRVSQEEEIIR